MNKEEFEKKYQVSISDATDTGCPSLKTISVYCASCSHWDSVYFVAVGIMASLTITKID